MTTRDLLRITYVTPSLFPAARTATATGSTVDLRGYDGAMVSVSFGAYTDGTHTPSLLESADGVTFDTVSSSNLQGSFSAISSSAGANTVQQVGYIGSLRYLAVVMTISGATTGALSSASVIAGYPRSAPTQ